MKRNPGGPEFRVQNQFTKYVQVAVIRTRNRYLSKKSEVGRHEVFGNGDSLNGIDDLLDQEQHEDSRMIELKSGLAVAALLEQLPANAKSIIYLRIYQRYDFQKIASITGNSHINTRNIYYRSIRRLRSQLNEYDFY